MTRNENTLDRLVRAALAVTLAAVALWTGAGTVTGIVLLTVAAVLVVTAAAGFCPLYHLLGISTYPKPHRVARAVPQPRH